MRQYYINQNNQQIGPLELDELMANGLSANSMVWHQDLTDWQPAVAVAEVNALLPKLPPPLPRMPPPLVAAHTGDALNDSPINAKRTVVSALPPQSPQASPDYATTSTKASPTKALAGKMWWAISAGAICLIALVAWLISTRNQSWGAASGSPDVMEAVGSSTADAAQAQQAAAQAQQAAAQAQQAADADAAAAAQKEAQRAWNREHFMEYVTATMLPGYSVGTFGGISNGYFQLTNDSGYRLQNVLVAVRYIKADGNIFTTDYITVEKLAGHSSTVQAISDTERGTSVYCSLARLEAPGLDFQYSEN